MILVFLCREYIFICFLWENHDHDIVDEFAVEPHSDSIIQALWNYPLHYTELNYQNNCCLFQLLFHIRLNLIFFH